VTRRGGRSTGASAPTGETVPALETVEACAELGRQMLAAARSDDWSEVGRLEQRRRRLAAALRMDDLPGDQAERLLPAMRRLVAETRALDELARRERDRRAQALSRGRRSAEAVNAYARQQLGLSTSRASKR